MLAAAAMMAVTGCQEGASSSSLLGASESSSAARMAKPDVAQGQVWPGGVIKYYFDPSIQTENISTVNSAIQQWQSKLPGLIQFVQTSATDPSPKLKIYRADKCSNFGPGAIASVSGTPTGGMSMCLENQYFAVPLPAPVTWPNGGALGVVTHEFGHVLGLLHEEEHPLFRQYAGVLWNPSATGCPTDPFSGFGNRGAANAMWETNVPDFTSIMIGQTWIPCDVGGYNIIQKSDGSAYGSKKTAAPSTGDIESVRRIYAPYQQTAAWNLQNPISLEMERSCSKTASALEKSVMTDLPGIASRWIGLLDPRIGGMATIPSSVKCVENGAAATSPATIRVYLDTTSAWPTAWSLEKNPGAPTTYTKITIYSKRRADNTSPIEDGMYRMNVIQGAFGSALGLPETSLQSVSFQGNNWSSGHLFPSETDVKALRSWYGSSNADYQPLIRFLGASGAVYTSMIFSSWKDVINYSYKSELGSASIIGRVANQSSTFSGAPSRNPLSLKVRPTAQYAPGYTVLQSGSQTLSQAVAALPSGSCPQAAITDAGALTATSYTIGNLGVFTASSSFGSKALYLAWNATSKAWIPLTSAPTNNCKVLLGYMN